MGSPHLAVGENVEAELLLLAQYDHGGVVQGLLERGARHAERGFAALGIGKPGGTGKLPTLVVARGRTILGLSFTGMSHVRLHLAVARCSEREASADNMVADAR